MVQNSEGNKSKCCFYWKKEEYVPPTLSGYLCLYYMSSGPENSQMHKWGLPPTLVLRSSASLHPDSALDRTKWPQHRRAASRQSVHRCGTLWRIRFKILNAASGLSSQRICARLILSYLSIINSACLEENQNHCLSRKHLLIPVTVYNHHTSNLQNHPLDTHWWGRLLNFGREHLTLYQNDIKYRPGEWAGLLQWPVLMQGIGEEA